MGLCGSKSLPDLANPNDIKLTGEDGMPQPSPIKQEQERQEVAATKMQAVVRGKSGRKVVPPLKQAPCNRYRVNVSAENFGDCLCGWPKANHSEVAFRSENAKGKRVDSFELRSKMEKKEKQACEEYRVNMAATNFGDCMCGRPRSEHTDIALTPVTPQKATTVDDKELRKKFVQKESADCVKYVLNMNSANFGECICGRPKAEHSVAALKNVNEASAKVNEAELRKKMTAKAKTDCLEFRLDMNPNAKFGQCVCGRPKQEHSDAALKVAEPSVAKKGFRKQDAEVRDLMIKKEFVSCTFYRLDVNPDAPFGQCVCGEPKARHSDLALSGKRMLAEKTKEETPPPPPLEVELPASPEQPVQPEPPPAESDPAKS
uniref:Uncharacterized protein n=1 Tax=Coccolithus braarudii TaxID=221442 RepID=A0A7S0QA62_9EUKA|mmetsp:Transcript_52012/g.111213  ORF Transcript_52012/g.111213 Transcript_52012/m.111213 type:complete len:374 (+) Transcript_52012:37-1158(+)